MAETAQTMTEFTYATGETDVIGDRFSPSVVLFWLKTSVAASNMRVMYKSPNTLLGVIPESQAVLKASNQGVPVILYDQSDAGQAYSDAVDRLLGKDVAHRFLDVKKQGFLQRLFGGRE